MNMTELRNLLDTTNGKVFSVHFIKKDGSLREMVCRNEVTKGTVGGSNGHEDKPHLYTVYDMQAQGFRCVNLTTVKRVKCGSIDITC